MTLAAALVAMLPTLASAQPADPSLFASGVGERNSEDDIRLRVSAGANLAYGNARTLGLNVGALFTLRQAEHAFLADVSYQYGIAATRVNPTPDDGTAPDYSFGDWNENVNNLNIRLRFDEFVSPDDAIFAEGRLRHDPFAFLLPQATLQAGYQRFLLREEKQRFWFEVGVDFSYQNFGRPLPSSDAMGMAPANQMSDRSIFAWKGLLGYTNETTTSFTYNTRLEVLGTIVESIPTPETESPGTSSIGGEPGHLRFQWVNEFRSTIEDWLQLSVDITGRFDSLPAGQIETWDEGPNQPTQMFDLIATLNLVGNFDLDGAPPEEEEEEEAAPECPVCPVCPAVRPCADVDGDDAERVEESAEVIEDAEEDAEEATEDTEDATEDAEEAAEEAREEAADAAE